MKVAMDVSVSERATLALAKYDMTFDANPQGMQPTKMMPADISDGKVKTFVRPHPTSGIIENWKNVKIVMNILKKWRTKIGEYDADLVTIKIKTQLQNIKF